MAMMGVLYVIVKILINTACAPKSGCSVYEFKQAYSSTYSDTRMTMMMFGFILWACLFARMPFAPRAELLSNDIGHDICEFDFTAQMKVDGIRVSDGPIVLYNVQIERMYNPISQEEKDQRLETVLQTTNGVRFAKDAIYLVSGHLQVVDGVMLDIHGLNTIMVVDSSSIIVPWMKVTTAQKIFLEKFTADICAPKLVRHTRGLECPEPTTFGICIELCTHHDDCGAQLCCSNGCGYECMDGV